MVQELFSCLTVKGLKIDVCAYGIMIKVYVKKDYQMMWKFLAAHLINALKMSCSNDCCEDMIFEGLQNTFK